MAFSKIISKLFGNKEQRDLKEMNPYVKLIKEVYPEIEKLSNDELRSRAKEVEKRIQEYVSEEKNKISKLKEGIEEIELEEREAIWEEIDKIEKEISDKFEEILEEVLPEAFAIMKDTARRFTQNEEIVVTANQFDKDLAAKHDFVVIDGDKAIYKKHWIAGGVEISWNMIHYDVQLFGGVVLHKGRIAEMATGEIGRAHV